MRFAWLLAMGSLLASAQVRLERQGTESISIQIDGKPFSEFHFGPETRKPSLAPLRTATGVVVTRSYPMSESVPGESRDHPHHRGLWFTHGNVNGYDFWGNEDSQKGAGKGKGTVVLKSVDGVTGGERSGSIQATFDWKTAEGAVLLNEVRKMTFYSDARQRTIDFDIRLKAHEKVTFGDTKEGTFAIRLATPLEEQHSGKMVDAQGRSGEKNVWGKRSEWVDYAGLLDGQTVGVAIFDHPENPRHPTYWHSRAYGLFAANPFGAHDFENDRTRDGSMTVERGNTLRFRYRVVIHAGDTQSAGIAALFARYVQGR